MEVQRIEKFEVRSSNEPSGGIYSYKNGNPIVTFTLGSVAKFLKPSSLRLNGKFKLKTGAGGGLNNHTFITKAGAPALTDIEINPRVSIDSCFQNITLSSAKTNQSLESVRQYGRLLSTLIPSTMGASDLLQNQAVSRLSTGQQSSCDVMLNNQTSFSLQLFTGLLQSGQVLSMGMNGLNGMTLTFELASDSQVLYGADSPANGGASYEISDLSLTGDYIVPDPVTMEKLMVPSTGQMPYKSWNSLYSVVNSSDSTQTFNLASSQCLSLFINYIPVSHTNSYAHDSFETDALKNKDGAGVYNEDVTLKSVSYSRGGLKIGTDYDLECEEMSAQKLPETGIQVNALNAVQKYADISHMTNQPLLFPYGENDKFLFEDTISSMSTVDAKRNFSTGLHFDRVSNQGVNFKDQAFSQRLQSTLDGNSPMSSYLFYLNNNILQYSPQGIQIIN